MDFFLWQDGRGVNSQAIDDDPNAAKRKKRGFMGRYGLGLVLRMLHPPQQFLRRFLG